MTYIFLQETEQFCAARKITVPNFILGEIEKRNFFKNFSV
uniref:Uncharacterized protein n=1 Tax=Arundo donax TaxID=35708 RepID=A0A0A9AR60_ARUDO